MVKKLLEENTTLFIERKEEKTEEPKETKKGKKKVSLSEIPAVSKEENKAPKEQKQEKEAVYAGKHKKAQEEPEKALKQESKIKEAVVPADLPEQPKKEEPEAKKHNAPAPKKRNNSRKNGRKPKKPAAPVERKEPVKIKSHGEKSEEIKKLDQLKRSKEEQEYDVFKSLLNAQKTREILWGQVYGVEPNGMPGKVVIAVLYNGIKVSIPDVAYFEPEFVFGTRYEQADEREKMKRRGIMAGYQKGARICFLVKAVQRVPITDGEYKGENDIICIGSRTEAMALLRDVYFFHKERKNPISDNSVIKIGDIYDANVIAVKEDHIVVECCGVETRIKARDVAEGFVENCKDYYKPGDVITVKIKALTINGSTRVALGVTGKITDGSKMINSMVEGSQYNGIVESVNLNKKIYNVRLMNGVLAGVLFSNVAGYIPLYIGDEVSVKVYAKKDTYVYGDAIKL